MSFPILLYAFSKAYSSKKRKEAEDKITTYGQIGGKGPVVEFEPGMDNFVPIVGVTGSGAAINIPERSAPNMPLVDIYAAPNNLPGMEGFNLGNTAPLSQWKTLLEGQGLTGDELSTALGNLKPIGQRNPKTNKFDLFPEPTWSTKGPNATKTFVNEDIIISYRGGEYALSEEAKVREMQKKDAEEGNFYSILRLIKTNYDVNGEIRPDYSNPEDITKTLNDAKSADENGIAYTNSAGKSAAFIPQASTARERTQQFREWIAFQNASGFDWEKNMDAPNREKMFTRMYQYILEDQSGRTAAGDIIPNPRAMNTLVPGKYPNEFAIPGFSQFFRAKVSGLPREAIQRAGDIVGATTPQENVSFITSINDVMSMTVPMILPDEQNHAPYETLLRWSVSNNSRGLDQESAVNEARARIGNILVSVPNPSGSGLIGAENQPTLYKFADLAQTPSLGSAPSVLSNAQMYFDPTVTQFTANMSELQQVGTAMAKMPTFNDKLSAALLFAPNLGPAGSVDEQYLMSKFEEDMFGTKSFRDMQTMESNIARSALEATRLITASQSLLFITDPKTGEVRPQVFGQRVGETLLTVQGFFQNAKAGLKETAKALGLDENSPFVSRIISTFDSAESTFNSIDQKAPNAGQIALEQFSQFRPHVGDDEARAAASKGQTIEQYRSAEQEAAKANRAAIEKAIREMQSGDSITANAAKRRYLTYIIAYTVASALQGGTGGRTISDQDVQNVINMLQPGGVSRPENEYAVLEQLKNDMMYKAQRGVALSNKKDPRIVYAAMMVTDLQSKAGYDMNQMILDRIKFNATSGDVTPQPPASSEQLPGTIPEEDQESFLNFVNRQRLVNQQPGFDNLEDAENSLPPAEFNRLKNRYLQKPKG